MPAVPPSRRPAGPVSPGYALAVSDLVAGYQDVPVVRDLSLEVRPGEVVALLGPNGAGKTTTLETIAGLNRPISGTVGLSGVSVGGTPAHVLARRGVALVPEGRALFPGLTVREHLRLAGRHGGDRRGGDRHGGGQRSRDRRGSREADLLDILPELRKCLGRRAGLLSGGEQQMLAVGRALVTGPRLLLVDEMSLGLAPVIVERLLPVLRRAASDLGASVLFVEQHIALALEISDRAYVMTHGRIRLEGTAADLRERRDLLAASYLGESAA
jgi:branched-chain amino acid transport system ATP-binding protein